MKRVQWLEPGVDVLQIHSTLSFQKDFVSWITSSATTVYYYTRLKRHHCSPDMKANHRNEAREEGFQMDRLRREELGR